MYFIKRKVLTTIACGLVSASAFAVSVDQVSVDARKLQAAQAGMKHVGATMHLDVTSVEKADALTGLQADSSTAIPTMEMQLTGSPLYSVSKTATGDRIDVHLYNTILVDDLEHLVIDGGNTIGTIEAALTQVSPIFVTTVSVDLTESVSVAADMTAEMLQLSFLPYSDEAELRHVSQELLRTPQIAAAHLEAATTQLRPELNAGKKLCGDVLYRSIQTIEKAKMDLLEAELSQIAPAASMDDMHALEDLEASLEEKESTLQAMARTYQGVLNRFEGEYQSAKQKLDDVLKSVSIAKEDAANRAESLKVQLTEVKAKSQSILEAAKANQEDLLAKLSGIYETLENESEASEHLVTKISHYRDRNVAETVQLAQIDGFDALDAQFDEFRSEANSAPAALTTMAVAATETTIPVNLDEPISAALATSQMPSAGERVSPPPTKRTRPAQNSLTIHSIENPRHMAMLQAEEDALEKAEAEGLLVIAQNSGPITDVKPSETKRRVVAKSSNGKPRNLVVSRESAARPAFDLYNPNVPASQDPLRQLVNIDFKGMDLSNVVALLAEKAQINVIAGTELSGTVTANLNQIPLGRAIEIVLRMNGLGILEEAGVYRITTYEEAIAARRDTQMIFLKNAQAGPVKLTLEDVVKGAGGGAETMVTVGANEETNVVVISGPREMVDELAIVVSELDVTEPVIPTITSAMKLNYSSTIEVAEIVKGMLTENGQVGIDTRSRMVVVTDIPVKVAEIQDMVDSVDLPVQQVSIEAMVVDALLGDSAETGVDWFLASNEVETFQSLQDESAPGDDILTTELNNFAWQTALAGPLTGGLMSFALAGDAMSFGATISAQIESQNAELLANPTIVTVENQPAIIDITTEFPYQERTQTDAGAQISSTEFKSVGTILEVTPQVTDDMQIISNIVAKESSVVGFTSDEIPIESKRTASTTLRLSNGQTAMIGGLRRTTDTVTERKVPVLGDIPVLNTFFKSQDTNQQNSELLIFLTCNVLNTPTPELTPYEKEKYDKLGGIPMQPNGSKHVVDSYVSPEQMRDPIYKWRRTK